MSTDKFTLIPVESTGKHTSYAFQDFADGSGTFGPITLKTYPESPWGRELRALRVDYEPYLSLGAAARMLGLNGAAAVSGLETGRLTMSDENWTRMFAMLRDGRTPRKDDGR